MGYINRASRKMGWGYRRKRRPKNRNYVKGRAREYRVIKRLHREGAVWVVRSYASHGPIDITAVFPDCVRLIQVKKDYLPPKERRALEGLALSLSAQNIQVEVWLAKKGRFQVEVIRPPKID
jgi:Holliday junction resolvase-like predicted endonuclease